VDLDADLDAIEFHPGADLDERNGCSDLTFKDDDPYAFQC
jgi:hypothetical protein